MHVCVCVSTPTCMRSHTHTHMYACTRARARAHTHAQTSYLHEYTHTIQSIQSGTGGDMFNDPAKAMKLQPTELPADPGMSEVRI